jgi:dTDP-4-dehydrorhamnose 3,5-epimerase
MDVVRLAIDGPLLITPTRHLDERGFFSETYNAARLAEAGCETRFVQDNHSLSVQAGVVRGLHFQIPPKAQDKLMRVTRGRILDVAVDIRGGSPTYGRHVTAELSAENWAQLFVPAGFAHGFCTLEPETEVQYKVSDYYDPDLDIGLPWDDPDLAIDWPVLPGGAVLSARDRTHPPFRDFVTPFAYDPADRRGRP